MEIPLHPAVAAEIPRGRDFLERVHAARRGIEDLTVTVPCPDGDNKIVFCGDGMMVDATFAEDLFKRYPGEQLGELLLAMCEEGYAQILAEVTAAVTAAREGR